ncbi:beta/alpha barrel domain-containing protein [Helicobacter salomonis]|uniref:indole-3-glycerol phosphate synthase n=1 Tax=Helicobacter salomonis TaxID=56878 RepID=UPI000CF16984|nr:indole-3-glycerol phosphate synthase [Helicobacter salomonis]
MPLDLDALKTYLATKQTLTPMEVLGRSLAYNPYVPRLSGNDLKRVQATPHKLVSLDASMDLELLLTRLNGIHEARALLIDFTPLYTHGMPALESLDLLGYIRRLSPQPLIHKDYFLDPYQLLESAVHGADAVVLDAQLLGIELKNMCAYASRLGLLSVAYVRSKADLKASILAKANALYLGENFAALLEITPQRCTILKDTDPLCSDDAYGVDGLLTYSP